MAEDVKNPLKTETQVTPKSNFEEEDNGGSQGKKENLFDRLFANGNKLLTVSGSEFPISNETRRLFRVNYTYIVVDIVYLVISSRLTGLPSSRDFLAATPITTA